MRIARQTAQEHPLTLRPIAERAVTEEPDRAADSCADQNQLQRDPPVQKQPEREKHEKQQHRMAPFKNAGILAKFAELA